MRWPVIQKRFQRRIKTWRATGVAETQKLASDSEPETIVDSDVETVVISMGPNAERKRMLKEESIIACRRLSGRSMQK